MTIHTEKFLFIITIIIMLVISQGLAFDEELENKIEGDSDAFAFTITEHYLGSDCSINILTQEENTIIMVFEFPGEVHGNDSNLCKDLSNTLTVSDLNERSSFYLCEMQRSILRDYKAAEPILSFVMSNSVKVRIKSRVGIKFDTVKITATSVRYTNTSCQYEYQVNCFYADRQFCLTKQIACDGNYNCATPGKYDEDFRICGKEEIWQILPLICTIILLIILVIFVAYFLIRSQAHHSKRAYFIFNENADHFMIHDNNHRIVTDGPLTVRLIKVIGEATTPDK